MSAGGLSYSGLINYGVVTLPSVDSWGTNMNILRNPSSSIMTRKIDKVGQDSSITAMVDNSTDRSCEAISVYARGVNPSVSVSYSNGGSNGGGLSGNLPGLNGRGTQASLPYPVIKDGAFRPPILNQALTLPLSRLPRVWTSQFSNPGFADYTKKLRDCGTAETTREVKNETLTAAIRPTTTYNMGLSAIPENQNITNTIKNNIIHNSANSGIRTIDLTQQYVGNPTGEINSNTMHVFGQTNLNQNKQVPLLNSNVQHNVVNNLLLPSAVTNWTSKQNHFNNINMDTNRFIYDDNQRTFPQANTNTSDMAHYPSIEINNMDTNRFIYDDNQRTFPQANTNTSNMAHYPNIEINNMDTNRFIYDDNQRTFPQANTNTSDMAHYPSIEINNMDTNRFIYDDNQRTFPQANTNTSDMAHYPNIEINNMETNRFIQSTNSYSIESNQNGLGVTSIEELLGNIDLPIKDSNHIIHISHKPTETRQGDGTKYIHEDLVLQRNLPEYETTTNIGNSSKYVRINPQNDLKLNKKLIEIPHTSNPGGQNDNHINSSRNKKLPESLNVGGFDGKGNIPAIERMHQIPTNLNNQKNQKSKFVLNTMQGRFN